MGVVQKGPTLTLFFGPQKTSFFRLFSTFSGFSQKRNRPTDATFDKNRSKNRISKKGKKTIKKRKKKKKKIKKKDRHKKRIDKKKGQKTKKTLKIKIYTISILSGKSNKKFRY